MDIEIHAAGGDDFEMGETDAEREFVGSPAGYSAVLLVHGHLIGLIVVF